MMMRRFFFWSHVALFCTVLVGAYGFFFDWLSPFNFDRRASVIPPFLGLILVPLYFSPALIWGVSTLRLAREVTGVGKLALVSLGSMVVFALFAAAPIVFFWVPYGFPVSAMIYIGTFLVLDLENHNNCVKEEAAGL